MFKHRASLYQDIVYKRGYIISKRSKIKTPHSHWKYKKMGDFHIYYDPLNEVTQDKNSKQWIFILGTAIDITCETLTLKEIAKRLLSYLKESEETFFDYLDQLAGRHFILYYDGNESKILSDATGMRSIFYSLEKSIIGSHYNLVNDYRKSTESMIVDKRWLNLYSNYHLPGNYTPSEDVFFLTPNTLLAIERKKIVRFFPRSSLERTSVNESVEKITLYVKRQLEELTRRDKKLLLSLSAGTDSRMSLSLTKEYKKFFTYFTYSKENYRNSNRSIEILQLDKRQVEDIVSSLDLPHKFIKIDEDMDFRKSHSQFNELLEKNTFTNHSFKLAKLYYDNFRDGYLHIRTNTTEIGKNFYRNVRNIYKDFGVNAMVHAYSEKAVKDEKVKEAFEKFYHTVSFDKIFNYDPYSMFYWEYRMGTWHTQLLLESDVAHDTYILFNAREILKLFLSIPTYEINEKGLFYALVEKNWPVLNFWKYNDYGNLSDDFDYKIANYGLDLQNIDIRSGSNQNAGKIVPFSSRKKSKQTSFFMESENPNRGDFVEATYKFLTRKGQSYYSIVQLRSPYENQKYKGRLKYQLLLNDEVFLEEDIASWKESNHINFKWIAKEDGDILTIRTIAVKNCEKWGWGKASEMYIERIVLREMPHESELDVYTSSPYSKILI